MEKVKSCSKCKQEKTLESFSKNKRTKDGLQGTCKMCVKEQKDANRDKYNAKARETWHQNADKNKQKYEDNKEIIAEKAKIYYAENTEKVQAINKKWRDKNPEKVKESKKKYRDENKDKRKEWEEKNIEKLKEARKEYRIENKDYLTEYQKQHYIKNRDKILKRTLAYQKKKMIDDSIYRLKRSLQYMSYKSLKIDANDEQLEKLLGCSLQFFREHIEKQFLNWMNWDNKGNCETNEYNCSWHLDHIIPISKARNEEEVYLLSHWSNFQPLCSKVNIKDKKAKMPLLTNLELNIDSSLYFSK